MLHAPIIVQPGDTPLDQAATSERPRFRPHGFAGSPATQPGSLSATVLRLRQREAAFAFVAGDDHDADQPADPYRACPIHSRIVDHLLGICIAAGSIWIAVGVAFGHALEKW